MPKRWFDLTNDEAGRLNPPPLHYIYDEMTDEITIGLEHDREWLNVGYIPTPRTWLEWTLYHFIHGIWMRYPLWKAIGFAVFDRGYEEASGEA